MSIPPVIYALIELDSGIIKDASSNKQEMICRCIGFNDFVGHKWGFNDIGMVFEYGNNGVKPIEISQKIIDKLK